ncbi:hypothetical protein ABH930_006410 [Kitasatospora sp. GAS204A]|uniref:hypothetical protein n=1 Tax=unclassified Kitasatospora TaxID=2633591 RepID=UPI0024739965|nr:hypothetical protein [Kitasatospora sp. GAS204B]MDH6121998.1 hypothetical protein [Kitasatospora sp. GAS204B]
MAKPSKIPRPTEDAAVGATCSDPRPATNLDRLWRMLAEAVWRRDRHGAQLIRALLVRAMSAEPVRAAS